MKRHSMIALALLAGCCTGSFAQQAEKRLTVEVSNEWTKNKTDEPIVIDLNSLKTGSNEMPVPTSWLSLPMCRPKAARTSASSFLPKRATKLILPAPMPK